MELNGSGRFDYKSEKSITADFTFKWDKQNFSRMPRLQIFAVSKDCDLIYHLTNLPFFPWDFKGETNDGRVFTANGLALSSRGEKIDKGIDEISLGFNCNLLQIGNQDNTFDYFEFYFPNVFIAFDEFEKVGKVSTLNISNIYLEYNGCNYNLTFSGLNEIVTKKKSIIENGEDILTVKITIRKLSNDLLFNEAKEVLEIISDLMGFVYGDPVNWILGIAYKHNKEVFSQLRDVNFPSLHTFRKLIPVDSPRHLTSYLSQSFVIYATLNEEKRKAIRRFNGGLHFSSERLVFPAPFTTLGSCIEDFVQYAVTEKDTHYIDTTERRKIDPSFAIWVKENIVPLLNDIDKADFNDSGMKQKLSALIQRNLRSRINKLLETYNIEYDQSWVSEFVKKRNSAAHGSYTFEKDDYLIWSRMVSLLERVILKEFNYKGDFIDWSVSPPITKEFS